MEGLMTPFKEKKKMQYYGTLRWKFLEQFNPSLPVTKLWTNPMIMLCTSTKRQNKKTKQEAHYKQTQQRFKTNMLTMHRPNIPSYYTTSK